MDTFCERLGKEAGLKLEGVKTLLRHEDIFNHFERLRRSWDGRQAADSAAAGDVRQRAGEGGRRCFSHPKSLGTYASISPVNLRDPYLTHVWFKDFPQAEQRMAPQVGLESA